jgi:hypothetical protein
MSRPRVAGLPRALALITVLLVLAPTTAVAVPVDAFAPYQPQRHCNPTPKPGTLELAAWLQRQYPGTGSSGISRPCGHGGVSEHKEGRAFDWGVDHASARDRSYVHAFLDRVLAPDADGTPAALARRMGIMYILWNDHIYASYSGFTKRDYLSSSCKRKSRCSDTLRHRDHVHISLSRAGARGDTSWYHRGDPQPAPVPRPPTPPAPQPLPEPTPPVGPVLKLGTKPFARIVVRPDGEPVVSRFSLAKGTTYKITAAGLFTYGTPDQVADAGCVWSPQARDWVTSPGAAVAATHGSLNLTANGQPVATTCHPKGHKYTLRLTPRRTGPLVLRVHNQVPGASGRLVVLVSKRGTDVAQALPQYDDLAPAPRAADTVSRGYGLLAETVSVPAASRTVRTAQELHRGARYRITVTGTAGFGNGVRTDGMCVRVGGTWYPRASIDRRFPDQDHGNLYLDGAPFAGRPTGDGCEGHAYTTDYTAARTGRLALSLWDPLSVRDNSGAITVLVQRLSTIREPRAAGADRPGKGPAWTQRRDWFEIDPAHRKGTKSTMKLRRGEKVLLVVRGVVRSAGTTADARCVATPDGWAPRDPRLALDQDPLELWVDGTAVHWRALGQTDVCSEDEHGYTVRWTATHPGKIRLAVLDLDHRDNTGTLRVTLLREK